MKRMQLVTGLVSHRHQSFAGSQALAQLVISFGWWAPPTRLALHGKLGEHAGIERIGFAAPRERFCPLMDLHRIDDTQDVASCVQADRQADPITAGCFKNDQGFTGWYVQLTQVLLQAGNAIGCLGQGDWLSVSATVQRPAESKGFGRYVNPTPQPIDRLSARHSCLREQDKRARQFTLVVVNARDPRSSRTIWY
jgi:hypothetical protein